jgi:hypothetical protein
LPVSDLLIREARAGDRAAIHDVTLAGGAEALSLHTTDLVQVAKAI